MSNHKVACFFLVLLIVGMLYGVNQLRNASVKARDAAEAAQVQAESAEQEAQLAQIQLKSLESKTAALRQISEEWKPYFERFATSQDAEQRLVEVIREGNVFLISQKFESREVDKEALISDALVADLVVEDDYTKTINWLGALEEQIPSCRISKCHLKRGDRGNDINLELQIQIPILNH
ncbi:MAG: hypothetical protein P1U85_23130 [Verrucomicrobiales bacterium]|jgi:Na+-transporting methylmalonyl-CoA/oxaloacetate decarboxylase gamma subunit|nr:hypothetical protein [Verrucomicrobiales bacterium]